MEALCDFEGRMPVKPGHEIGNHNLSPTKEGLEPKVEAAQRWAGSQMENAEAKCFATVWASMGEKPGDWTPPSPHSPVPAFTTQRHPCTGVRRTEFKGHDSLGG